MSKQQDWVHSVSSSSPVLQPGKERKYKKDIRDYQELMKTTLKSTTQRTEKEKARVLVNSSVKTANSA